MRLKCKKVISMALAAGLLVQSGTMTGLAESGTKGGTRTTKRAQETVVGSDVWSTPLIPDAAVEIAGVSKTEINLNETTGNGDWKFLFDIPGYHNSDGVPVPKAENQDFDFTDWTDRNWQNIKVPGEAVMQGFDILTNNEYYYQREITIPEDFTGNRILVRFDGVYSNTRVWIDGKYIRTHVGGFTTWDCDITKYAEPGETVTMTVGVADLYSDTKGIWNPDGKMVNNPSNATEYAHHNIGGILRDVSLVALPFDFIARTYVNTDLEEGFENANLEVTAQLGMRSKEARLLVELLDGEQVVTTEELSFEKDENLKVPGASMALSQAMRLTLPVENPKKWDAEHPNLYTLRTTLMVEQKKVQVNEEKIGFREIHYGGREGTDANRIYVNGKEVKLRGTCRHDVSDDLGRSMTREEAYREAEAYKKANINFIRTSHYPASEDLLDACDEMGIYVEQETAVCFQGYGTHGSNVYSKYEDYLPQFTEMIERDRNRASILIWSLGNESNYSNVANQSGGNAFQTEKEYLLDADTTRPSIFSWPNTGEPWDLADIYSQHYANVQGGMGSSGKPVLHDEYAHIACYNMDELQRDTNVRNFWGESIKKAWENIFTSDGALGGALWGGIDDVFYIPEGTTKRWQSHSDGPTAGYGEWGSVLDAYLREKPEAYLTKKAYSPVRVDEASCYVTGEILNIPVKNWFDHTDMNELEMEYTMGGETRRIQISESIRPHSEGVITVPGILSDVNTVNLKFYTSDGIMIDEYNVELGETEYHFTQASQEPPVIQEKGDEIVVKGEGFSLTFSKITGLISEGTFGKEETALITGGPYLHVTGMELGKWIPDGTKGIQARVVENYVEVSMKGNYENGQGLEMVLKISGNGIITTKYTLTTNPAIGSGLQEVGICFDISSEMESVSWFREGLYSAYPEDHIGRNKGTALKKREGSANTPDKYGVEPSWPWKDDEKNYFVYEMSNPNNGLVTNDFKAMRENVYSYDVNYGSEEDAPRISVEAKQGNVAARVDVSYKQEYIDDRDSSIQYSDGWNTFDSGSDHAGTETYSTKSGDTCEMTFEGTGVRYIGARQNNTGKVKIYIDGELKEEVDTYSDLGNHLKQSVIYSIDNLEYGKHTIRLVTSGGNADCIVVDAFEVLNSESLLPKEDAKLMINHQWYYPNLAWGNYTGFQGNLYQGYSQTATIRMDNNKNFSTERIPVFTNVEATETGNGSLEASYELRNAEEGSRVKIQWYQIAEGDPDSKAQVIEGAEGISLNTRGLEAYQVYFEISVEGGNISTGPVKSNFVKVGEDSYQYHDILSDSEEFVFKGTEGVDYQTDREEEWTANAYGRTVTYLLDTKNPTVDHAEVSYTFFGNGIRWIGAKEENQGIAEIVIDKELPKECDLFGKDVESKNQVNEILFEKRWEEAGEHTITIKRTGRKHAEATGANINLDAFLVLNTPIERVPVEGIDMNPVDLELKIGEKAKITATVKPENATNKEIFFTSEKEEVAVVDSEGNVTGTGTGETVLAAISADGNFRAECKVKVRPKDTVADISSLLLAVTMAEKLEAQQKENNCYTENSWAGVRDALERARMLLTRPEASQEEADVELLNLITACNMLESGVQKAGLWAVIEGTEAILASEEELEQYTEESITAVKTALREAEQVYANDGMNQETVNEAARKLMDAVTRLLLKREDTRLDILIRKAEELLKNSFRYTPSSIEKLKEALEEATAVSESGDPGTEEINQAYNQLAAAMASLVRKGNKDELKNALDMAEKILQESEKYLGSSIENLSLWKEKAQRIYDDVNAEAESIGEILKKLIQEILKARLMGDADLNGVIDTEDSAVLLKYNAELMVFTEEQKQVGDVNRDGTADSSDAAMILQFSAEKIIF